jgi:membrane protease YdiL (CAAX protease family)
MLAGFSSFRSIGLHSQQRWLKIVGWSLIAAFGIQLVSKLAVNPLMDLVFGPSDDSFYVAASESIWGYLAWLVICVLFSGFFEEFVYRGFELNYLIRELEEFQYHVAIRLILTSIAFGLGHYFSQGATGIIPATILGFFFGLAYLIANRNLWFAILTHGWFNFISFTLDYTQAINLAN